MCVLCVKLPPLSICHYTFDLAFIHLLFTTCFQTFFFFFLTPGNVEVAQSHTHIFVLKYYQ